MYVSFAERIVPAFEEAWLEFPVLRTVYGILDVNPFRYQKSMER
jgi:hypothetical protein